MGLPAVDLDAGPPDAEIVIIGAPHATPYSVTGPYAAGSPAAIRAAVAGFANALGHVDFDLDGPLLGDGRRRVVDAGDLPTDNDTPAENRALIERAVRVTLD